MDNGSFRFGRADSAELGIRLSEPMRLSGAKRIVKTIQIPGRNGRLLVDTGAYENRKATAKCFFVGKYAHAMMELFTQKLMQKPGYQLLKLSTDPDHYLMGRLVKGPDQEVIKGCLIPFNLEWDCKPQRFRSGGETEETFVTSPSAINNPGSGEARPLIRVIGNGASTVIVNGYRIDIRDVGASIYIDCDSQNAYQYKGGAGDRNSDIQCEEFPILIPGNNTISWTGKIDQVRIIPRWWDL